MYISMKLCKVFGVTHLKFWKVEHMYLGIYALIYTYIYILTYIYRARPTTRTCPDQRLLLRGLWPSPPASD